MVSDAPSADAGAAGSGEPLAIICGGGSFPSAGAEAIKRRGCRAVMFPVRGWADPKVVERYTHHWIAIGQAGRFFRLARAEGCREAVFIGTLLRPPLTQIRPDWQMLRLMPRIAAVFRGGDDRLLSGIAALFEEGGVRIIGVGEVAPEIIVPEGMLGRSTPSERDRADIAYGLRLIATLGPFDISRAVVVADGHVVAVKPRRHGQYADAGCAIARRRTVPAARCRRPGQKRLSRVGPPVRPAGDRSKTSKMSRAPALPGSPSPPAARLLPGPTR
jgi:DUF1009 family protein